MENQNGKKNKYLLANIVHTFADYFIKNQWDTHIAICLIINIAKCIQRRYECLTALK